MLHFPQTREQDPKIFKVKMKSWGHHSGEHPRAWTDQDIMSTLAHFLKHPWEDKELVQFHSLDENLIVPPESEVQLRDKPCSVLHSVMIPQLSSIQMWRKRPKIQPLW